ncbi:MAG: M36 family metallopeptidase [Methylococcaceae bacterium]
MNKITPQLTLAISLLLANTTPYASTLPENYDVLANSSSVASPLSLSASNAALIDSSHAVQVDDSTQLPTFLWATANNANAARLANKNLNHATIEQAARAHLNRYKSLYKLDKNAQATAKLEQIHHLANSGYIVRFGQQVSGIEVFTKRVNVLLDSTLQLNALSGHLAPQVSNAKAAFKVTAKQAIAKAFQDLQQQPLDANSLKMSKQQGVYQWYGLQNASLLSKPVRLKKVFYPLARGLEPSYYLELNTSKDNQTASYAYVISAKDGTLLLRHNLVHKEAAPFTYRVWADSNSLMPDDSPFGNTLTPLLSSSVAKPVTPVVSNLISLSCGLISTCDPWLAEGATQTSGNNVIAYADLKRPNGFGAGDVMGQVSAPNSFDYAYNFSQFDDAKHPLQLQAAITQAFYTTNFMHDWLYDHGFDEASGNAQLSNYGRGGVEGDAMHVEVNDYDGIDNANMEVPLDGEAPIMQMFLWTHDGNKRFQVEFNGKTHRYNATTADFGSQNFNLSGKKIVLVDDGSAIDSTGGVGSSADACQTPFVNASDLIGAVALIDRGDCFFDEKVKRAQEAGAIAVLIANNRAEFMIPLGGSDKALDRSIKIPTFGIEQNNGRIIKHFLKQSDSNVTASLLRKIFPPYNGALDNTIIIHEWAHFLSLRLVWLNNQQGNSMGEGWSDFLALVAMVQETDRTIAGNEQFQAPYAVSQYASANQLYDYPLGIRRYPYSTDLSKNPLTFKHISDGVALPRTIAANPTTDLTGSDNAEVHNSGEVWTSMLWEAYTALLNDTARLTFSEAQNRMLDYLVASLKLTPVNPTFLEARDALLAVAKTRDIADYTLFWKAFAKRGAGVNAKAPTRYSKHQKGVVEDYTTP